MRSRRYRSSWIPMTLSLREFSAAITAFLPSDSASRRIRSASAFVRTACDSACTRFNNTALSLSAFAAATSPCSCTRFIAISRDRSAIARSRWVCTCSCASTKSVRANSAFAWAFASSACFSARRIELSTLWSSEVSCASISSLRISRCFEISLAFVSRSRSMRACSVNTIASSRAFAVSESLSALTFSISRRWPMCASSSCCSRFKRRLVASNWVWRTAMSASDSISVRCFLLVAMISASLRIPTALKALFSSSDANGAWSSRVSDTESSSTPFCDRLSRIRSATRRTNSPRFSCRPSMVSVATTDCNASMKRPSNRLRMPSGLSARAPRDCAAVATPSTVGCTRT